MFIEKIKYRKTPTFRRGGVLPPAYTRHITRAGGPRPYEGYIVKSQHFKQNHFIGPQILLYYQKMINNYKITGRENMELILDKQISKKGSRCQL